MNSQPNTLVTNMRAHQIELPSQQGRENQGRENGTKVKNEWGRRTLSVWWQYLSWPLLPSLRHISRNKYAKILKKRDKIWMTSNIIYPPLVICIAKASIDFNSAGYIEISERVPKLTKSLEMAFQSRLFVFLSNVFRMRWKRLQFYILRPKN